MNRGGKSRKFYSLSLFTGFETKSDGTDGAAALKGTRPPPPCIEKLTVCGDAIKSFYSKN